MQNSDSSANASDRGFDVQSSRGSSCTVWVRLKPKVRSLILVTLMKLRGRKLLHERAIGVEVAFVKPVGHTARYLVGLQR